MDLQRAMLDELLGADRDLTEEERKDYREITWNSKEVCPYYMARFCPHDLFVNTRSDLGPCDRIHDPKLKESFEKSPRHDAYLLKFESELAQRCERLVIELDRRVRRGRERIAQDEEPVPLPPLSAERLEQLSVIEEKIKNLLVQVESLGEVGKVDEAQALMKKVDELNVEKNLIRTQNEKGLAIAQEKKMALCETCGSFLVANDAAERTQSHITGKQHVGYSMVRDFISEYKAAKEKAREEERDARGREVEMRRKSSSGSSSRRGDFGGDRDRDRDHHRPSDRDREGPRERSAGGRSWERMAPGPRHRNNGRHELRDSYRVRPRSRSPLRQHGRRSPGSQVESQ